MLLNNPIISAAISQVCREPATKILLEFPELDHNVVISSFEKILHFVKDAFGSLGQREYLVEVNFSQLVGVNQPLTVSLVQDCLNAGANILELDSAMNMLSFDKLASTSLSGVSQYSRQRKSNILHVLNGLDVIIYSNGIVIKEMNVRHPLTGPVTRKKFARHAHDYELSVIEHYLERVRYSQFCYHWADRSKRILSNEPDKTEKIFHVNLQNWLDENLEGASILGSVKKVTSDETDIEIRVHGDEQFYVLEIKWLGSNGKTKYTESRVRDGIAQVKQYLLREPDASEVCLVVYDGRGLEEFRKLISCFDVQNQYKKIQECQSEILPSNAKGYVFFLENENASKHKS